MLGATDNTQSTIEPDTAQMRSHLERLFRRPRIEYPGGLIEIAWANDKGAVTQAELFPLTDDGFTKAIECAVRYNNAGRNVYVGVNPRKPTAPPFGRSDATDVEIAYFHFVEADALEAANKIRKAPLLYTWAVTTGRIPNPRPHVYWELDEPVRNMQAWAAQQRALAANFGGDNVSDPPRIMRLAGTVNYPTAKKIARGYQVELVTIRTLYGEEERDPVTSEALFRVYPWTTGSERVDPDTGEIHDDEPRADGASKPKFDDGRRRIDPEECVRNINAGHNLHNNARDLIAHLVATGHRDWLIVELLERLLKPVSDGGTLGQIPNMIRTARQKWGIPDPEEDWDSYAARNGGLPLEWFGDIQPSLNTSDFVEGLLCDTAMSVVYGESNCGKTFFMTDLAFHIATGRSWRGRQVDQGGVIYVALEGGFGIRNRLAALRIHYAIGTAKVPFGIVPCSINMLDANADTGPLIELVNEAAKSIDMPIKLVVIDTLARAMNGGNENAPEDMGKLVKSADRIREQTGAHVAFVHHSGKDQARGARGHSSLRAATDTEIEITRDEDATYSFATVTKQRELEIEGEFAFSLEQVPLGTNKRGKPVTSCIVVEAEAFSETKRRPKLTDHELSFMVEIRELMAHEGVAEYVVPEPGMPVLKTLKRDILRDRLISRGKLAVTDAVTGLSNAERQRLFRVLNALRDKGFIEMNATRIWVLE